MKYARYPVELKKSMVARFFKEPDAQMKYFCEENGIKECNLRDWIREAENGTLGAVKKKKNHQHWNLAEKFEALQEYDKLDETEQGKWLRLKGFSHQRMVKWEKEIKDSLIKTSAKPTYEENNKVKALEKELKRKEKALVEASAILFAKKKLDALLGGDDEDN